MRKRKRHLGPSDAQEVLETMRACHKAMAVLQSRVAPRSTLYREATAIMCDLDDLALLITGKRGHFTAPLHGTKG